MSETFLNGKIEFSGGDCLAVLPTLAENSIDSCVCDPPYLLTSIVKRFGNDGSAPASFGKDGRFRRLSGGFMGSKWDAPDTAPIDPGFAYWLGGFIDGEGCFSVHKKLVNGCQTYDCQFTIQLREDDANVIAEIQKQLGGIGTIAKRPVKDANPQVRYCISSQKDCWHLREVLSVFPLRAKKARDFEIWSQALDAWIAHEPGSSWEDVAYFRDALMAVKKYGAAFHPAQLFHYRWARGVYRVLKPGAHLLAFGGTRTYHRMACAIEDAGFEIRDTIMWVYGSGFPKSHDVSKGIDRAAGASRDVVGQNKYASRRPNGRAGNEVYGNDGRTEWLTTAPATDAARQWEGWGTALKPACEPIVLARKPLSESTVAANVLRWGVGALNIDGTRIPLDESAAAMAGKAKQSTNKTRNFGVGDYAGERKEISPIETFKANGRWPANLIHDGSEEVLAGFPETVNSPKGLITQGGRDGGGFDVGSSNETRNTKFQGHGDSGSAARFFYTSKADTDDRLGSKHPTVKPLDLMQYLVRLVTRKGGVTLDPFAGTGTTGEAAFREGMRAVLIERESEYQDDIRRRIALVLGGPDERANAAIKQRMKDKPIDAGPLFANLHEE